MKVWEKASTLSRNMPDPAKAATNVQEDRQAPPQASAAAPATQGSPSPDSATSDQPPPLTNAITSWATASTADKQVVLQAIDKYYKQAGFERSDAGWKARIIHPSNPTHSTSLLAQAARLMQNPDRTINKNTIRLKLATQAAGSDGAVRRRHFHEVRNSCISHFNGGTWVTPIEGADLPEELKHLICPVTGVNLVKIHPARDSLPASYEFDVSFVDQEAFDAALNKPFCYAGKEVPIEFGIPDSLAGVVELRVDLKDLNTPEGVLKFAFGGLECGKLLSLVKRYETVKSDSGPDAPIFGGKVVAYFKIDNLKPDEHGSYRSKLLSLLPSTITIGSHKLPLRHNFEDEFCPRCKFAGHSASTCPKFPCSACNRAGHVSTDCTDPTGRRSQAIRGQPTKTRNFPPPPPVTPRVEEGWRQAPSRRSHNTPRISKANATPLGNLNPFAVLQDQSEGLNGDMNENFPPLAPVRSHLEVSPTKRPQAGSTTSSIDQPLRKKPAFEGPFEMQVQVPKTAPTPVAATSGDKLSLSSSTNTTASTSPSPSSSSAATQPQKSAGGEDPDETMALDDTSSLAGDTEIEHEEMTEAASIERQLVPPHSSAASSSAAPVKVPLASSASGSSLNLTSSTNSTVIDETPPSTN